jgi:hypothetical protein
MQQMHQTGLCRLCGPRLLFLLVCAQVVVRCTAHAPSCASDWVIDRSDISTFMTNVDNWVELAETNDHQCRIPLPV